MIRKILLSVTAIFTCAISCAQVCSPDTSLKETGLAPATLPHGQINVAYDQTITVRLFRDTTGKLGSATIPVRVDSMLLLRINNLPAGITYQCLAPNCRFLPLINTCIKLSGTPTTADSFPLDIIVRTYGKSGSFSLPPQTDTVRQFSIVVDGTGSVILVQNEVKVYPQPASNSLTVLGIPNGEETWVSDLQGKNLKISAIRDGKSLILPIGKLPSGMYLFHHGNRSIKFIKE